MSWVLLWIVLLTPLHCVFPYSYPCIDIKTIINLNIYIWGFPLAIVHPFLHSKITYLSFVLMGTLKTKVLFLKKILMSMIPVILAKCSESPVVVQVIWQGPLQYFRTFFFELFFFLWNVLKVLSLCRSFDKGPFSTFELFFFWWNVLKALSLCRSFDKGPFSTFELFFFFLVECSENPIVVQVVWQGPLQYLRTFFFFKLFIFFYFLFLVKCSESPIVVQVIWQGPLQYLRTQSRERMRLDGPQVQSWRQEHSRLH